MKHFLPLMSTVEIRDAAATDPVVFLPVGTIDSIGPHLPVGASYLIAEALAKAVAEKSGHYWMPAQPYGATVPALSLAGALPIPHRVLERYLEAVVLSLAKAGLRRLVFVTMPAANQFPVATLCRDLRRTTGMVIPSLNPIAIARDIQGGILSNGAAAFEAGGEFITSLMLHLLPEQVLVERAPSSGKADFQGLTILSTNEVAFGGSKVSIYLNGDEVAPDAAWGNAAGASTEKGAALFAALTAYMADFAATFRTMDPAIPLPPLEI